MGLLNNLGGTNVADEAARVLGRSQEAADRKAFDRDFGTANFDEFSGETQPGKNVQIAEFTVPASTEYSWGYGSAENAQNQGHLYFDLQLDTTDDGSADTQATGSVIFAQETPTGRGYEVVAEYDISRLVASKSDKQLMVPFPEQVGHDLVTKDSHLTVYVDTDQAGTVMPDASDVILPVTEYDLGTN